MAASRTPQLDNYLKPEVSSAAEATNKELASIQTHVLDALAPLSAIMEAQEGSSEQTLTAVMAAIKLLGNASARISHLRHTKITTQMNKALLPLVEEDSNFKEVSPSPFGPEFAQKSKKLVDQVKAMQSTIAAPKQFFQPGLPPTAAGLHSQTTRARRSPELSEKQPTSSGKDVPKEHMEQVTYGHTFLNSMIMN